MSNTPRLTAYLVAIILSGVCACLGTTAAAFTFTPGHIYTTNYSSLDIMEYDSSGNFVDSITLPSKLGSETRGIAFGPDNLLYVTMVRGSGFAVYALDSTGAVQQTYQKTSVYVAGNISFGKIAIDRRFIYVAGQDELIRFTLGRPRFGGRSIYTNNQVLDAKVLPRGSLFVASAYAIDEITNQGTLVRHIILSGGPSFVDVRGIEYDPATDKLFVTELGYTNFFFQLMRINASTGQFEQSVTFSYADDLFLSESNTLLVGSRTDTPRVYSEELAQIGTIGTAQQMFVTQYTGP
jgi:DNA-binding beta-propeller fold protein YncE